MFKKYVLSSLNKGVRYWCAEILMQIVKTTKYIFVLMTRMLVISKKVRAGKTRKIFENLSQI